MKSRETLIRLKRFQVDEKRRRVAQIEAMIAEFSRMAGELDREIANEEQKTNNNHPTYSAYARPPPGRRDNLKHSAGELRAQLEEAKQHLADATEEFAKAQSLEGRE